MEKAPQNPEGVPEKDPVALIQENFAIAEEIGEKTNNKTAHKVLGFLRENARVIKRSSTKPGWEAANASHGAISPEFSTPGHAILNIYVYNPADREQLPPGFIAAMHVDDSLSAATYNHANRFLLWRQRPERSRTMNGLYLLHEGWHAWWQQTQADVPPDQSWNHERDAHLFTYELVTGIGGEAYQEILRDHVAVIRQQAEQSGYPVGSQYLEKFNRYEDRLDALFGPTKDNSEKGSRMQLLHTHGLFTAIQDDSGSAEETAQRQATVLSRIYQKL